MFTVYPAIGSVAAGGQITIQVDCLAESQGKCEEVKSYLAKEIISTICLLNLTVIINVNFSSKPWIVSVDCSPQRGSYGLKLLV